MEYLRMIVVEDEQRILSHIVTKIQNTVPNCEIIATARNGKDALQLAEKYRPDIVFSDIKMPQMNGLELARILRERLPHTFVVLLSGYSEFSFAREAMRYGVSYYLLKPLETAELLEVIEDIREKIEEKHSKRNPYILASDQNGLQLIFQEENVERYRHYVLTFCFYNLCCPGAGERLAEYYEQHLKKIDWAKIMGTVEDSCLEWIVVDGTPCNIKNIVITVQNDNYKEVDFMIGNICDTLRRDYIQFRKYAAAVLLAAFLPTLFSLSTQSAV